jgi:hypothetical protein
MMMMICSRDDYYAIPLQLQAVMLHFSMKMRAMTMTALYQQLQVWMILTGQ